MKNQNNQSRWRVLGMLSLCVAGVAPSALGQVVHERTKFAAQDVHAWSEFGASIAVDDGVVAVGAIRGDGLVADSGVVYLFDAGSGEEVAKLFAADGESGNRFGKAIAIDDGVLAVGVEFEQSNGFGSGAVYLFDVSTGEQLMKVVPSDGSRNARFGSSVAMEDGLLVVGAPWSDFLDTSSGAAYVFRVETGELLVRLVPQDAAPRVNFGRSVSVSNGVAAVGANTDDEFSFNSGSAYLFDVKSGAQLFKLHAFDAAMNDSFGQTICIHNGLVVVGSPQDDDHGEDSGSAYVFDVQTGELMYKLGVDGSVAGDRFGVSVALDDEYIVVGGAYADEFNFDIGSVAMFSVSTGAQINRLLPAGVRDLFHFGISTAIDNGVVYIGADGRGSVVGAGYIFERCPVDFTFDGIIDFFDVSAFIQAYIAGDQAADFVDDGVLNFFDLGGYIGAYAAGCP